MSHASLALAVALGSLPVCLMLRAPAQPPLALAAQYGEPNQGNCRPDIGPGGIIQVFPTVPSPSPTLYQAMLVTTPMRNGELLYVGNGATKVQLTSWETYKLEIDYSASPPKARLLDKTGTTVLADFPTIEIFTRLSSDPKNPLTAFSFGDSGASQERKVMDQAFHLEVHHKKTPGVDALAIYQLTTVSMIKVAP